MLALNCSDSKKCIAGRLRNDASLSPSYSNTKKHTTLSMRVISKEQQEEAGRYAMKGFAIGAAQWGCVGVFATTLASAFFPGFRKTPVQNKVGYQMAP